MQRPTELVRTRGCLHPTSNTFQTSNNFRNWHSRYQLRNTLQVTIASTAKGNVFQDTTFHFQFNVGTTSTFCFIIIYHTELLFFRTHVGINGLHIIKLLQAFYHLVDSFTLFWSYIFQIIGNISKFTTYIFKTLLL